MNLSHALLWRRGMLAGAVLLAGAHLFAAATSDPDVTTLSKNLSAADAKDRAAAVDALADLGSDARSAVPALVGALRDKSVEVRWRAARALGTIGNDNKGVSHALTDGLKDDSAQVRAYSAHALGRLGDSRPEVAEAMSALITDPEPMVRRAALKGLRQMKLPREVSIPLFVKALSNADQSAVMGALQTIAESGHEALPFLMDALNHPRAAYWACLALAEIGPPAKEATTALARLTTSNEPEMRLQASMALGAIGPDAKDALPNLIKMLQSDPLPGVRYAAAFAIGRIGVPDVSTVAALKKAGESEDKFLNSICAWAIARINPTDQTEVTRAVKLLLAGLKSDNVHVRRALTRALQELKATSDLVGPALVAALKDTDPAVLSDSMDALSTLGPQIVPQLAEILKDKELRLYAAVVLARFGADAKDAAPQLVALLDDPSLDRSFRREVQYVLGQIGPDAAAATPQLIKALDSDYERVRNSAIFALGKIGPPAKAAIPALEKMENSDDPFVRVGSLWALVHIQPGDAALVTKAVPELVKSLDAERDAVRMEVAHTLAQIGPAAKGALPALEKVAKGDQSAQVRDAASKAIAQIEGNAPDTDKSTGGKK